MIERNLNGLSQLVPKTSNGNWPSSLYPVPTYHKHHHLHTIASISCLIQLFGATIFYIAGISGFVIMLSNPSASQHLLDGIYWAPQVIGGLGFVISGWLFMIESQEVWWIVSWKDLKTLGWHVGFWNLIGGIGFTVSAIFYVRRSRYIDSYHHLAVIWSLRLLDE